MNTDLKESSLIKIESKHMERVLNSGLRGQFAGSQTRSHPGQKPSWIWGLLGESQSSNLESECVYN